jgi:hypothetical protein
VHLGSRLLIDSIDWMQKFQCFFVSNALLCCISGNRTLLSLSLSLFLFFFLLFLLTVRKTHQLLVGVVSLSSTSREYFGDAVVFASNGEVPASLSPQ